MDRKNIDICECNVLLCLDRNDNCVNLNLTLSACVPLLRVSNTNNSATFTSKLIHYSCVTWLARVLASPHTRHSRLAHWLLVLPSVKARVCGSEKPSMPREYVNRLVPTFVILEYEYQSGNLKYKLALRNAITCDIERFGSMASSANSKQMVYNVHRNKTKSSSKTQNFYLVV